MKNHQINLQDVEGFAFEHEIAGYYDSGRGKPETKSLYARINGAAASYGVVYNGKTILRNATLAQAVEAYNGI